MTSPSTEHLEGNRESEIPCRVSSYPHEMHNDLSTVSKEGSAKLTYP